jgi:hypothetical protein
MDRVSIIVPLFRIMRRVLPAALFAAAMLVAPADAALVALDTAVHENAPIIAGDRVVWSSDRELAPATYSTHRIQLRSAPLAGGAVQDLPVITVPRSREISPWDLAGSASTIAVRFYEDVMYDGSRDEIRVSRAGGPFTVLPGPVRPSTRISTAGIFTEVASDDVITTDIGEEPRAYGDDRIIRHAPEGAPAVVPLPDGADQLSAVVGGDFIAVTVTKGAPASAADSPGYVAVLDAHTGAELRRIAIPREMVLDEDQQLLVGDELGYLAVGADGTVVIGSLAVATKRNPVIGWAAPDATRFAPVRLPRSIGNRFKVAAGRLAATDSAGLGSRVVVYALPSGEQLYAGPRTSDLRFGDAFDGDHVAWSSRECVLVASVPAPPDTKVPAGPCSSTEVVVRHPSYAHRETPVTVRCVVAPGDACDVRLLVRTEGVGRVRRLVIPIGAQRRVVVHFPRSVRGYLTVRAS